MPLFLVEKKKKIVYKNKSTDSLLGPTKIYSSKKTHIKMNSFNSLSIGHIFMFQRAWIVIRDTSGTSPVIDYDIYTGV